jgi:hypothetical protein
MGKASPRPRFGITNGRVWRKVVWEFQSYRFHCCRFIRIAPIRRRFSRISGKTPGERRNFGFHSRGVAKFVVQPWRCSDMRPGKRRVNPPQAFVRRCGANQQTAADMQPDAVHDTQLPVTGTRPTLAGKGQPGPRTVGLTINRRDGVDGALSVNAPRPVPQLAPRCARRCPTVR